ncbi:MAG TPA: hypothetical protein VIT45_13855 [Allosphingosinicella sp.]
MSEIPDPVQTLLPALLAAAVMVAAAPQLFMEWLRRLAEQQRTAILRQQAIQDDLLRRMAMRDSGKPQI